MNILIKEFATTQRLKFALFAFMFGVIGIHRLARRQYISACVLLFSFCVAVFLLGVSQLAEFTFYAFVIIFVIAVLDGLSMLIFGRFFLDEKNVKINVIK